MNRFAFAVVALAITSAIAGCSQNSEDVAMSSAAVETSDGGTDASTDLVALQTSVQDLLAARCGGCHIDRAAGGLSLTNFAETTVDVASAQLASMKRIAPKDRDNSYLFRKIAGTHLEAGGDGRQMPPNGALTAEEIELVGSFIDAL